MIEVAGSVKGRIRGCHHLDYLASMADDNTGMGATTMRRYKRRKPITLSNISDWTVERASANSKGRTKPPKAKEWRRYERRKQVPDGQQGQPERGRLEHGQPALVAKPA
ncbi:MAG: hypothetical protein ACKVOB_07615 [Sphingomonas sp.]